MQRQFVAIAGLLALLIGLGSGCGWWGSDGEETAETATALPVASITTAAAVPEPPTSPVAPPPAEEPEPIKVGDRFPMLRTVTQTLTQNTPDGQKTTQSTVQYLLTLRIEELPPDGRRRLSVWYDRVRYIRDLAGQSLDFDSGLPPQAVLPLDAVPYRGLANNGFSFWVDSNGAVVELVGYEDFLKRCVRDVPLTLGEPVLQRLAGATPEEAIAGFVDDSIGLLPAAAELNAGRQWPLRRHISQPVPIILDLHCTLASVNDRAAEIDLAGMITPADGFGSAPHSVDGTSVSVRGGRTVGHATIDRRTGLPLQSRIEHYIDMLVHSAAGQPLEQRKHIVTTIQALPEQTGTR